MNTADFLATVPLFRSLDACRAGEFAELVREKTYPKGSVILFEDDPGDSLFVVRAGRVKVVLVAEDGREVILGILGVGEHFGELSLIDDQPRSAHVIAMEDSSLLVLRREDFRRRVEASPSVAWSLLQRALAPPAPRRREDRLPRAARRARAHRPHAARRRATRAGVTLIEKPLTHQTIAHVIGASRETVSRAMREFQDSGWISTERRRIRITDRAALEKRAQQRL